MTGIGGIGGVDQAVSVASAARSRTNGFDFVRLVAALFVIVEHSWLLAGRPGGPLPSASGSSFGQIGVGMFFLVSGVLVATSWLADPSVKRFLARRALRIYPAYLVVIVLLSLVMGPLLSDLAAGSYFSSGQTWGYLVHNLAVLPMRYILPGVFSDTPHPAVNGSIWSIRIEVLCYLGIVVLGLLGVLKRRTMIVGIAVCALILTIVIDLTGYTGHLVPHLLDYGAAEPIAFFALGMLARPLLARHRVGWWPTLLACSGWAITWGTPLANAGSIVAVTVVTLALALDTPPWLHHPTGSFDLSYGTYLLAFPVQQCLVQAGLLNPSLVMLATVGIVLPSAALSWRFVESPALRLKPRRPSAITTAARTDEH